MAPVPRVAPPRWTPRDEGNVLLVAPEGCPVCSWDGTAYRVMKNGLVEVPAGAYEDLRWHGFTLYDHSKPPPEGAAQ